MTPGLLAVNGLSVAFRTARRDLHALCEVSFSIGRSEIVGIVGESGCGKSTLLAAITRVLPSSAEISGSIVFDGVELTELSDAAMRRVRGRKIGTILQNSMTALDPLFTVGSQLTEVLLHRAGVGKERARHRAVMALQSVNMPAPQSRLEQYPHELSGGMLQRVVIAMNECCRPQLILADEPTTALDVTVQEGILQLFESIRREHGASIILVTHDLGVIRKLCDRILVMYAGCLVEEGPVRQVFGQAAHPYTRALLRSLPADDDEVEELYAIPGQVPDLARNEPGCGFAERCELATSHCHEHAPVLTGFAGRRVACWEWPSRA